MNIERAVVNKILIVARQTLTPSNWLCSFTRVEDTADVRYCVTQNEGNATGPMLLEVEEKANPVAINGEVELPAGDYMLSVYEQTSTTNVNPAAVGLRHVSTEQVRVE